MKQRAPDTAVSSKYTTKNIHVTQVVRYVSKQVNTRARVNVMPAEANIMGPANWMLCIALYAYPTTMAGSTCLSNSLLVGLHTA